MFPETPSAAGGGARSSSRNAAVTKSPPWRIRSDPRSRRMHSSGSTRVPRGRCVSEMTATRVSAAFLSFLEGARERRGPLAVPLRVQLDADAVGSAREPWQLEADRRVVPAVAGRGADDALGAEKRHLPRVALVGRDREPTAETAEVRVRAGDRGRVPPRMERAATAPVLRCGGLHDRVRAAMRPVHVLEATLPAGERDLVDEVEDVVERNPWIACDLRHQLRVERSLRRVVDGRDG